MRFLDVNLSEGKLIICGSQNILSDLRLRFPDQCTSSFRDCSKIVISSFNIYTRASNLSGMIVEQSNSAMSRRILWSFPARKSLLYRLRHSVDLFIILKSLFIAYALRLLSINAMHLDFLVLFIFCASLLYILSLIPNFFKN
ncbi:unnamed protein product [Hymenolepis diminuta]|uniref:Uncharacterized protein n=1 Tax=Hymenolepis diminuta TaxID=6216 RepID=A0A564YM14_HYMDI|nr:unnamed protein product [Hymenolepis diminuta]